MRQALIGFGIIAGSLVWGDFHGNAFAQMYEELKWTPLVEKVEGRHYDPGDELGLETHFRLHNFSDPDNPLIYVIKRTLFEGSNPTPVRDWPEINVPIDYGWGYAYWNMPEYEVPTENTPTYYVLHYSFHIKISDTETFHLGTESQHWYLKIHEPGGPGGH